MQPPCIHCHRQRKSLMCKSVICCAEKTISHPKKHSFPSLHCSYNICGPLFTPHSLRSLRTCVTIRHAEACVTSPAALEGNPAACMAASHDSGRPGNQRARVPAGPGAAPSSGARLSSSPHAAAALAPKKTATPPHASAGDIMELPTHMMVHFAGMPNIILHVWTPFTLPDNVAA